MVSSSDDPRRAHWETVYREKAEDEVSWFQEKASHSLSLIAKTGVDRTAPIVDVGGGAEATCEACDRGGDLGDEGLHRRGVARAGALDQGVFHRGAEPNAYAVR